jgi:hypothetical protein
MIALVAGLAARRREPRTDLVRAGLLLWGVWLIVLFVAFSATTTINTYYTAALSPAIAGLLSLGLALAWQAAAGQVQALFRGPLGPGLVESQTMPRLSRTQPGRVAASEPGNARAASGDGRAPGPGCAPLPGQPDAAGYHRQRTPAVLSAQASPLSAAPAEHLAYAVPMTRGTGPLPRRDGATAARSAGRCQRQRERPPSGGHVEEVLEPARPGSRSRGAARPPSRRRLCCSQRGSWLDATAPHTPGHRHYGGPPQAPETVGHPRANRSGDQQTRPRCRG